MQKCKKKQQCRSRPSKRPGAGYVKDRWYCVSL